MPARWTTPSAPISATWSSIRAASSRAICAPSSTGSENSDVLVLGIETSCDETAAAVVEDGRWVRADVVASQILVHAPYGGVVPEVASRQHVATIIPVIQRTVADAGISLGDLDAIAVTCGPGLVGALLVGVETAKSLAFALGKPLVGVNHRAGHLAAVFLQDGDPQGAPNPPRDGSLAAKPLEIDRGN